MWFVLRLVGHAMIATYLVGAFMWSMPDGIPLKQRVVSFVDPVFQPTGLWQGWLMFAPSPRREDIYVDAVATFADGTTFTRNLAQMWAMGYFERYRKERNRKFFNDYMRSDQQSKHWPQIAGWLARDIEGETGRAPKTVELVRHWRPVEPGLLATTPNEKGWSQFKFYSYNAPAEVSR